MRATHLVTVLHAVLLTVACSSYRAAPLTPSAIAAEQHGRQIDLKAVQLTLDKIAPAYHWDGAELNELTLLAAALSSNPDIRSARARLDTFSASVAAAKVMPGPTITLSAEYALNPAESSPWLFGVAGDAILANGGRRHRVQAAEIARRGAEFEYLDVIWNVRMALRRALDQYSSATSLLEVSDEFLAVRRRQFDAIRHQSDAGEASRLDLDRVRSDVASAEAQSATARARLQSAKIDLAAAIGVPPNSLDLSQLTLVPGDELHWSLTDDDRLAAFSARPEILQAMTDYDQAETALRSAVAAQFPEIRIGPGYIWERGLTKFPFSLSLAFPSADFNAAAIHAAESKRTESGRRLEAAIATVTTSIDRAVAGYDAALAGLNIARQSMLPAALAISEQADRELKLGSIDRGEWAASQAGALAAKIDQQLAIQAVRDARAALEEALRRPLAGPELQISGALVHLDGDMP